MLDQEEMLEQLEVGDLVEYMHNGLIHKSWVMSFHTLNTIKAMVESGYYTLLRLAKLVDIEFMESEEYQQIKEKTNKKGESL